MATATGESRSLTIGGERDQRTSLRVISSKFYIGREEYYPLAAEMHYYRVAKRHWSVCFERIRRAGFRIITTSVPWNVHEMRQGEFDFAGLTDPTRDLIVFLELAREFGFKIILKPGPWIGAEWKNGGLPDFVFKHQETLAKGPGGEPLGPAAMPGNNGKLFPAYLSTRFQILLKNYFTVFGEVIRNYIYPRGPVFMIEIDHETSFGGNFNPFSGDYAEQTIQTHYPRFLQEKYGTVEIMSKLYGEKIADFAEIEPLAEMSARSAGEFTRLMDWVEYRDWIVNRYADSITELLSQTEIAALFSRSYAWSGHFHFPDVADIGAADRTIITTGLDWDADICENLDRVRAVSAWQPIGFITQFAVGHRCADPSAGHKFRPISERQTKRLLVTALAGGAKAFNFHMFVGRSHWYDAALENDGGILPSYDVIRHAHHQLPEIHYDLMDDFAQVVIARYRPYLRAHQLGEGTVEEVYPYLHALAGADTAAVGRNLNAMCCDHRIVDLTAVEDMAGFRLVVAPVAEFMSPEVQTRLVDHARRGGQLLLFGVLPRVNERGEPCEILAKAMGVKTQAATGIEPLEYKSIKFKSRIYGVIRRSPSKSMKLVKSKARLYGVSVRIGKGKATLLTFDPGAHLHPDKLRFFGELIASAKVDSPVSGSDSTVFSALHAHDKGALLYVIDMEGGLEPVDNGACKTPKQVVLSIDLSGTKLGSRSVMVVDLLGEDAHRLTPSEIRAGFLVKLERGGSRLFYIEQK